MSARIPVAGDADIDLAGLFSAIWRDKLRIVLGALLLTGLVFLALSMVTPKYKSDARVLIETNESVFTRPQGEGAAAERVDSESVSSQVQIITSNELLTKVADELKLGERDEFDAARNISLVKRLMIIAGLASNPAEIPLEKRVLDTMREKLEVYAIDQSRVIGIEFSSSDPELAAQVANSIANAYVALESDSQLATTGEAASYLAKEIQGLQADVRLAEAAVAEFRSANGLFVGNNDETLATQQLTELSTELSRVRSERSQLEARVRSVEVAIQSGAALDTLPDVISSPLVGSLSQEIARQKAEMADLSTTLLANHPRMKALRSQIDGLETQLRDQAQKVLAGLRNEARIAQGSEAELESDLARLKAVSAMASDKQVELNALEREAASQRELLETYLIRFREARSRDETRYAPAKARLISSASVPFEPVFPKMLPMLVASFIGGLLLMVVATLMKELFSGRALVPTASFEDDYTLEPVVPVADAGPAAQAAEEVEQAPEPSRLVVAQDSADVIHVADALFDRGSSRIFVITPEGEEGSINTVALAREMDERGLRTILVDLTGTGASSRFMVDAENAPGISDLLANEADFSHVIHNDDVSDVHVIPVGIANARRALKGISRLPSILGALESAYDVIIIDCAASPHAGIAKLIDETSDFVLSFAGDAGDETEALLADYMDNGIDDFLVMSGVSPDVTGPGTPMRRRAMA